MKVIILTYNFETFNFENVLQVSTTFVGYDEDSQKYNQTSVIYLDKNGHKQKSVFRSDNVSSCIVLK